MFITIKFPLKMSERAFVCQLTLLNIDKYSNILIKSSINTNEMFSRVKEKRNYVIDITFVINESIFCGNEQQKVYYGRKYPMRICYRRKYRLMVANTRMNLTLSLSLFFLTQQG